MPELYLVPENPNLYATESGTYGTDLNVQLFANGTNLFNPEALLSVEGKFSVRYGKEKPKPGGQELLPFSWKVYLPERTEGYRIINEHTPHEDGSIDVNLGQWIPAKPHEVIEMPVFATFKIPDWSRLYLFVAIQIKISDPVFTQGYDKDHGWTQTWRVGWAPVRGAPKIPNWFSVGESEPPDFWYETPEKFVKDKTIRHTNIFACEGCGTLRGFDNRPELSRGVYAIGLDPNTEKSIEILVPWRPWSWATPVFTWFLVGLGGLALAGAVGIWKRSVTGRDTSGAAGPSSPD
uniref:hypothetical protein n=1 Tax=Paenarthrobacter ureafaciens TaxID=37931 RepID=UPI003F494F48